MRKLKKVMSIMLVFAMLCTMLMACGKKDDKETTNTESKNEVTESAATQAPTEEAQATEAGKEAADLADIIPDEPVTLTVFSQTANYQGEQIGWFAQVLKEKFNVVLNIVNSGEGVFNTRLESGSLGDIIVFGNDTDEYQQAIDAGLLWDWEDEDLLVNYGPYINANMQTALDKNRGLNDGKVYGFGYDVASSSTDHGSFIYHPDIRWDIYEQIGSPEVKTLEDFVDVLEKMVEACPTSDSGQKTYAMSLFKDWDGDTVMYVKSLAALYGYDEFGFTLYNVAEQKAEPVLAEDSMYIRALKFYNALNQKGLLDPDSMTQTYQEACDMYTDGAALFNIFTFLGASLYNTETNTAAGKGMYALAADDMKNICYGLNIYGSNRVWGIGSDTDYPELCMAIINWLATPEGYMTSTYGPKGVTWDYDDKGNAYMTDLGYTCQKDIKTQLSDGYSGSFEDGQNKMNLTTWAIDSENPEGNGETYNYLFWNSTLEKECTNAEQKWRDATGYLTGDEYLEKEGHITISVGTHFSSSTRDDDLATTWNQVAECIKTYTWQAMFAKDDAEFNSIVDEMRTKATEYGYQDCVDWSISEAERRAAAENEVKALGN